MDAARYRHHAQAAASGIIVAGRGSLKTPVPTMPGYDLGSLLLHTGYLCRFYGQCAGGAENPEIDTGDLADDPVAWHEATLAELVGALEAADPSAPAWTWRGEDRTAVFWFRRAAQEFAVHRWDAESAVGEPAPVDPALAADGIDELLDEFAPVFDVAGMFGGAGETIHLHATDHEGEWLVAMHPDRVEVRREHARGDVAVRGTASDLLLFLWGRVPPERLEVFGDASLLERWQERVKL